MEMLIIIPILISWIICMYSLPKWIKKCHQVGFLWKDMNKLDSEENVAASGGVIVVMSFILGVLSYIAVRTFILEIDSVGLSIFALLNVILILSLVGFVDDVLGWTAMGLSRRFRLFLALIASVPLVVINSGSSIIDFPFLGFIDLGIIYPLVLIPIGIAGATTTYNFLAGFNGLETGQGIIILSFLSFVAYLTGSSWLSIVGLCMVVALLVFYVYNKFPARVFPGDVLTYSIGALIAGMAILGNFEKIAVFVFIPYIIETILKSSGGLKKHSFGKVNEDGSLDMPYDRIYGLTHLSIFVLKKFKRRVYEWDVTYLIFIMQIIVCLLGLVIFKEGLF